MWAGRRPAKFQFETQSILERTGGTTHSWSSSMSPTRSLALSLLLVSALASRGAAQERIEFPQLYPAGTPRPGVMVLGTPHLANNGRDMNNAEFDDVLSP